MPQPALHSLTKVLLLWLTFLSIIQMGFITYFFTVGHHDRFQNSSAVASEHAPLSKPNNGPLSTSEPTYRLGKGKMLTFKSTGGGDRTIRWAPKNPIKGLISVQDDILTIEKDGYYFLSLQVTLKDCEKITTKYIEVSMMLMNESDESQERTTLAQARINKDTCTGLLTRATELSSGSHRVTIDVETSDIDKNEFLTYLDIIYISLS